MTDREDGRVKVTGAAAYAADHRLDGLVYGYVITSTIAKGVIRSMHVPDSPGVLAVYSPFNPLDLRPFAKEDNAEIHPALQSPAVRYYGQAVGLVVAETFEQARDAAARITCEYDEQPISASFADGDTVVADTREVGDVERALATAAATITATYTSPAENHAAMEPHPTIAVWDGDDVTVHTATQGVRLAVERLSEALGLDPARIHVINRYVGGGFGNKWDTWAHTPLTVAAARALGRPVKTVLTREQVFTVVGHRPATRQTVTLGADAAGRLVAVSNDGVSAKAATNGFYESVADLSMVLYGSPNLRVTRGHVTLDSPVTTIMRAPGESNGSFALESALDELADELGMDPLDLRRRNDSPVNPANGRPWSSKHLAECYDLGAERIGWSRRAAAPGTLVDGDWLVGLGMATATYGAFRSEAAIRVRLQADGRATVGGTAADLGTGQSTVFALLAAGELGIGIDRVTPELGDSALPVSAAAGGSGSTSSNGPAVQLAAEAAKQALLELAVGEEGSPFHGRRARFEDGEVVAGELSMPFEKLLAELDLEAVEATATSPRNGVKDHAFRSFGAHFCEVRVNRWTMEPRVSRWVCVADAGTIVNEKTARSQVVGGVIMGIGQALLEDLRLDPRTGRFGNANLADYLVPVNADIPPIDVQFLNYPDTLLSPLGARGIGEFGNVGAAGAIANAIHHATGRRVRDLPITLDKLL